jgi:hypothetical protein
MTGRYRSIHGTALARGGWGTVGGRGPSGEHAPTHFALAELGHGGHHPL